MQNVLLSPESCPGAAGSLLQARRSSWTALSLARHRGPGCHGRAHQGCTGPDNMAPGSRGHANPSTTIRWRFMEGRWATALNNKELTLEQFQTAKSAPPVLIAPLCGQTTELQQLWLTSIHLLVPIQYQLKPSRVLAGSRITVEQKDNWTERPLQHPEHPTSSFLHQPLSTLLLHCHHLFPSLWPQNVQQRLMTFGDLQSVKPFYLQMLWGSAGSCRCNFGINLELLIMLFYNHLLNSNSSVTQPIFNIKKVINSWSVILRTYRHPSLGEVIYVI